MKRIVNITLRGDIYCDGKELRVNANGAIGKKLAALVGVRIIKNGELTLSISDGGVSKSNGK